MSEKPVHSRLRRLVDWINLTGAKKVHSLIDKVQAEEPGDGLGEGEGKSGKRRCRWAESGGFRGAAGPAVGPAAARAEGGRLSASTGATTPHPEEGQTREYRMLGIPTIYDRVCQQALLNRLEPIFEPVF